MSSFSRKHDSISTFSHCYCDVRDFCPCWCWVIDHAFQHVCCYNNWFLHTVAPSNYVLLYITRKFHSWQNQGWILNSNFSILSDNHLRTRTYHMYIRIDISTNTQFGHKWAVSKHENSIVSSYDTKSMSNHCYQHHQDI